LKMEQYRRGERFVAGVFAAGGDAAVGHLWDGPASLPTDAEMDEPRRWVERVVPEALTADGRPPAATRVTDRVWATTSGTTPVRAQMTPDA
ncbi:MAG: zinc-dependent metalloprotease, partial [Chloroflexi bacterium]|nr:zinc-dependent metalloprotease [Chloroflexota bacterium]